MSSENQTADELALAQAAQDLFFIKLLAAHGPVRLGSLAALAGVAPYYAHHVMERLESMGLVSHAEESWSITALGLTRANPPGQ